MNLASLQNAAKARRFAHPGFDASTLPAPCTSHFRDDGAEDDQRSIHLQGAGFFGGIA
jgi:hypothetical protein